MQHFIDIQQLNKEDIHNLFSLANSIHNKTPIERSDLLAHKTVITVFFENSTRTSISFQLAANQLGASCIHFNASTSSSNKGESDKDTLLTLAAMRPDCLIIRHADNDFCETAATWLSQLPVPIINAGNGTLHHPTQALLDLYTIQQNVSKPNPSVCIVGDILHSRVASSLIDGLNIMGQTDIRLFGPDEFLPPASNKFRTVNNWHEALTDCDVIIMLRIQKERIPESLNIDYTEWHQSYGLNQERMKLCKPEAIVMHPGPMNRGIEISEEVADGEQSVILRQVTNGVLMRQALLTHLLN